MTKDEIKQVEEAVRILRRIMNETTDEDDAQNLSNAIVYIDCALQNNILGKYIVRPQVFRTSSK